MRKTFGVALAALATIALAGPAEEIKMVHDAFTKAALNNNGIMATHLIAKHMTEDFTYVDPGGKVQNRAQWANDLKMQFGQGKTKKFAFTLGPMKQMKDGTLALSGKLEIEGSMKTPDGKSHKIEGYEEFDELWVKQNRGGVKCKRIKSTAMKMLMDGKPMPAPGGPPPPVKLEPAKKPPAG